jgi:Fe-S oxidoreductase
MNMVKVLEAVGCRCTGLNQTCCGRPPQRGLQNELVARKFRLISHEQGATSLTSYSSA